ncbi:MAG TPA: phosphate transport system regulatory protein PhoU [Alphaproteobacteria bacterium]|nr:phosphate transport system regulatory protein PhoU [Alphaproteobacteria bacterium]
MEKVLQTHTVSSFDKELNNISSNVVSMSELVIDVVRIFLDSLSDPRGENLSKVEEIDNKVNELDRNVEKISTNIIALRHPLAIDLRYVIAATKISTIIERQGDMIESAVKKLLNIETKILNEYKDSLTLIANYGIEMLSYAIKGYKNQDTNEANKVWRIEDKVDDMCDELFIKIKNDIRNHPSDVDSYVSVMLIVRGLERIADYCTKITKAVHYVTSGERVSERDF